MTATGAFCVKTEEKVGFSRELGDVSDGIGFGAWIAV
jgi:hypothetical protein